MSALALPVFLLGLLSLVGTLVTLAVAPLTPRTSVPACCRRRVDAFAARARLTLGATLGVTGAGAVLLVVATF
jgi:hypothetical protein